MKKILGVSIVFLFAFATMTNAQEKDKSVGQEIKDGAKTTGKVIGKGAKKAGHAVGKGAKATGSAVGKGASAVGKKSSEIASKGAAKVVDKTYEGKAGPNGETVYINENAKYYYVDKKGHRHYVTEAQLTTKVE